MWSAECGVLSRTPHLDFRALRPFDRLTSTGSVQAVQAVQAGQVRGFASLMCYSRTWAYFYKIKIQPSSTQHPANKHKVRSATPHPAPRILLTTGRPALSHPAPSHPAPSHPAPSHPAPSPQHPAYDRRARTS